tara:strand:- start:18 stop:365 length:348 start_codon:yes stop_codon:yes gene_type:complete
MKYNVPTTKEDFYFKFLSAINGVMNLSNRERVILGEFMKERDKLNGNDAVVFSSVMRKRVQKKLDITEHNLNNYIKSLKEKKAILQNGESLIINKAIIPDVTENKSSVTFNFSIA